MASFDDAELDDEFLSYLSGDAPTPVRPPPPSPPPATAMTQASARSETNPRSVASMAGVVNPSLMKVADAPVDGAAAPAGDRAGALTMPRALLDMAEAYTRNAGSAVYPPRGPSPRDIEDHRSSWASAPPLEDLIEDGFFDYSSSPPSSGFPDSRDRPSPRDVGGHRADGDTVAGHIPLRPRPGEDDRGRANNMPPLAEAHVIMVPVCGVVPIAGPAPDPARNDEEGGGGRNGAQVGWLARFGKKALIGLASIGLVAVGAIVAVIVMPNDDPITTTTSSTAIMTSTSSTAITTATATTTTPEINMVSEKNIEFSLYFYRQRPTSRAFIVFGTDIHAS